MSLAEKLQTIAENEQRVYDAGYEKGKAEGVIPMYHTSQVNFANTVFPENYELYFRMKNAINKNAIENLCINTMNIKKITLQIDDGVAISLQNAFRNSTDLEVVDLTRLGRKITSFDWCMLNSSKIKSVYGALDFSECTSATIWLNSATALEDMEFVPNTINISIDFYWCTKLSKASITSAINGLSDTTSNLAVSFSKFAVNKAFETTVGANDGSSSSEWLALIATKPNWTINLV